MEFPGITNLAKNSIHSVSLKCATHKALLSHLHNRNVSVTEKYDFCENSLSCDVTFIPTSDNSQGFFAKVYLLIVVNMVVKSNRMAKMWTTYPE